MTAAAGRTQLRGSRMADSSHSASSIAEASVSSVRRSSSRSESATGGSTGTSALRSMRSTSFIVHFLRFRLCGSSRWLRTVSFQSLLELLDRTVQQHLGGAFGTPERPRYLAVVHAEREAHDERLASVV